ncbi:ABC transporter substrate-binding protein [Nocardioides albus]|uniref:Raffinose/stachyose/melibiose transport system substrate-binding protein n=1 Tax=Nocardioides albus TaxID=1841 RepID=A0A7W5A909_9ACTN|nr:extracellular solute-binding protein [Nocardioides albus]MBB3091818.1 raffinose/stachyose/melibiose transport system substrate-binding protein [Nocardioides albus]GGU31649.1 sugar ABC transporter substrate-binding protein [Nocardioides albus]
MSRKTQALAALCAGLMIAATGCGGSGDSGGDDKTITWWHNSNNDPGKGYYEQVAKDFEKANPGIDVKVQAFAHEDMLTKLDAAFQSGDVPDVYMERGGGELADHVEAGLTRDLSEDSKDIIDQIGGSAAGWQVDGKTYALPFSMGVVGFWYNTELFEKAGITAPPTTMQELYAAFDKLDKAGITPVSLGAGDGWPAAHYWYYTALRACSQDVLESAVADLDFSDPCFVQAGETVDEIVAKEPFNKGFLSTPSQTGPTSASGLLATGKVAMELAGHWEPGVMQGITEDKQGLGEKTGWFPFPAVDGGAGDPTAQLGGGDAWAVSEAAPDKAVDLVNYLLSDEVQKGFAENDMGLPTIPAAGSSVKDPALADLLKVRDESPFVQLYFDTAFGESIGGAMNDEIALQFAGKATPEDVVTATQEAADKEK